MILVIRTKQEEKPTVNPRYLYHILADDSFFHYAMKTSTETKMPCGNKRITMKENLHTTPSGKVGNCDYTRQI